MPQLCGMIDIRISAKLSQSLTQGKAIRLTRMLTL
jgi:hypothetical protein